MKGIEWGWLERERVKDILGREKNTEEMRKRGKWSGCSVRGLGRGKELKDFSNDRYSLDHMFNIHSKHIYSIIKKSHYLTNNPKVSIFWD